MRFGKINVKDPEDFAVLYDVTPDLWEPIVERTVNYLKRNKYRIFSNKIPVSLLLWWQRPELPSMDVLARPGDLIVHHRRRDLLLQYIVFDKVFQAIRRQYRWQCKIGEQPEERMATAYECLAAANRYLLRAYRTGETVPTFDLLKIKDLERVVGELGLDR